MAYGPGNIPCAGGPCGFQHAHNANNQIRRTVCGNIAHGFPLEIVAKYTHGSQPAAMCFNFVTLNLCQSFPFSCSVATLIVCVVSRLPSRIPIMGLAFHVRAGGASLAGRPKSSAAMLTFIMELMIQCCRLIMHYQNLKIDYEMKSAPWPQS
jgi:hypothetical protein